MIWYTYRSIPRSLQRWVSTKSAISLLLSFCFSNICSCNKVNVHGIQGFTWGDSECMLDIANRHAPTDRKAQGTRHTNASIRWQVPDETAFQGVPQRMIYVWHECIRTYYFCYLTSPSQGYFLCSRNGMIEKVDPLPIRWNVPRRFTDPKMRESRADRSALGAAPDIAVVANVGLNSLSSKT